jgi:hypothetical protein
MNRLTPGCVILCGLCCLCVEAEVTPFPSPPAKIQARLKLNPPAGARTTRSRGIVPPTPEAFVDVEKIAVLDNLRLGMIVSCHTPVLSTRESSRPTGREQSAGYYLVAPLTKSGEVPADRIEVFGPLWNLAAATSHSGRFMFDLSPKGVRWRGDEVPYFDLRQSHGLIRWQHEPRLDDDYLSRSFFNAARQRWTPPQIVSVGCLAIVGNPTVFWGRLNSWMEPGRLSLRQKKSTGPILIYDAAEDRFVDDPWLRGPLADIEKDRRFIEYFFFTDDGNWLIVLPNSWPTSELPDSVVLRGASANRFRQFWVFHRGKDRPWVADRIQDDTQFRAPRTAFVDKSGKLLLGYELESPRRFVLASFDAGKSESLKHVLRKDSFKVVGFDAANSTFFGYSPSDVVLNPRAALDQDGAPIGFSLRVTKWKYAEGRRDTVNFHLDDLIEINDGKTILKAKKPIPIVQDTPTAKETVASSPTRQLEKSSKAPPQFAFVPLSESPDVSIVTLPKSPDGKTRIRLDGGSATLIDAATGKQIGKTLAAGCSTSDGGKEPSTFTCWAFSPDGKYVVTGSRYYREAESKTETPTNFGNLQVWDAATGELLSQRPSNRAIGGVRAVGFKQDNKTILFIAERYSRDVS